jgi:hypothetical protein
VWERLGAPSSDPQSNVHCGHRGSAKQEPSLWSETNDNQQKYYKDVCGYRHLLDSISPIPTVIMESVAEATAG